MQKVNREYYMRYRAQGMSAANAKRDADIVARAQTLTDVVRIKAEPEQEGYFDVFGAPDDPKDEKAISRLLHAWGCWIVCSEYKHPLDGWVLVDSIGMCVYENPECPFENHHVADLLSAAIKARDTAMEELGDPECPNCEADDLALHRFKDSFIYLDGWLPAATPATQVECLNCDYIADFDLFFNNDDPVATDDDRSYGPRGPLTKENN